MDVDVEITGYLCRPRSESFTAEHFEVSIDFEKAIMFCLRRILIKELEKWAQHRIAPIFDKEPKETAATAGATI